MKISELLENASTKPINPKDMVDAYEVFKDWMLNTSIYTVHNLSTVKPYFKITGKVESIPLKDCMIFHDWGRRVGDENINVPIIVLKMPAGYYQVLDGQHRVLTKKSKGETTIFAQVIELPWIAGSKKKSTQRYYID